MIKLIKGFWYLSILIFLACLLYVYAAIQEDLTVELGESGLSFSKETFFYIAVLIFAVLNVVFYYASKSLGKAGRSKHRKLSGSHSYILILESLKVVLNFTLVSLVVFVGFFNRADDLNIDKYGAMVYVGPFLFGLWILYSAYVLITRKKS